jgi:hypothetical protein
VARDDTGKVTLDDNGAQRRRNDAITLATSKSSSSGTVRRRSKAEPPKTLSWDDLVDPDVDKTQPRANESIHSRVIDISEDEIDIDPDDFRDTGDPKNVDKIVVEKILAKQRGEEVIDINGKLFHKVPARSSTSMSVQLGKDALGIEDDHDEPSLEGVDFDVDDEDDKEYDVNDLHVEDDVEDQEDETPISLTRVEDDKKSKKPQLDGRSGHKMESRFSELMNRANTLSAGGPDGPSMYMPPRLGGPVPVTEMGGVHAPQRSPDDGTIMNVREWTSQFKYTAEQEYVRIQREHPAVYAGYSAKGWLCDAYESFDESYLANVWGGGTYRLTAFQGVDRSRPSATGVVVINGVPKAYRGSDGSPVAFPEVPNPGGLPGLNRPPPANAQQSIINGQMQMPIAGMSFVPQMTPMGAFGVANANPGMSAADVLALAKQASEDSASRNQNHLAFDAINKMTQQFQEQQSRTVDVVSESAQKLIEPLQRTIEMYKATLEDNQRKHASELDALYRQHQLNLDRVREDFKAQNEATRLQYDQMLTQSRNDATARENANRDQTVARENYAREQYNFNIQALTRELDNIRSSRVTELESLRNQLTLDATAREARAIETAKMFYEGRISALQEQLRSVEALSNTRITDIKESGSIQLSMTQQMQNNLLSSKDMEINRLQSELNMVRMEVAELRDKSDPLKAIAGAVSFKKQFDELTGNGPAPVEEEPKNFLGMLAKYGPSINSNLIAPVMDPVKKAIDAAKQDTETKVEMQRLALQQRQQEIEVRQMMINQQQAEQTQQAQQAAINQQFRAGQLQNTAPVVAPVSVPQVRPQAVAPVQLQPHPQPQPQPQLQAQPQPQTEPIEGHDQETEKNLIEFLSNALDNNTSITDIMHQISMGRSLGVISDTTYQAFIEVPEKDIVETIKASAITLGKPRLASPRGEKFLYDILKELRSGK